MELTQLVLTLLAALLAIESGIWKDKKPTRAFWIAAVAIASTTVGGFAMYHQSNEKAELREIARTEIRKEITAISESAEVKELFKKRGASQNQALVSSVHKRVKIGKDDLNAAANRHIGHLEIEERAQLIKLISTLSTIDEFMQEGHTDLTGSAARIKLWQAKKDGLFDLLDE